VFSRRFLSNVKRFVDAKDASAACTPGADGHRRCTAAVRHCKTPRAPTAAHGGPSAAAAGGGAPGSKLPSAVLSAWKKCATGSGDAHDAGALRDAIQAEIKSWVINRGAGETPLHRAARLGYYVS
jgi:hypothetical protein